MTQEAKMATKVIPQKTPYAIAMEAALVTARGAVKGALFGSMLLSVGQVYRHWFNSSCGEDVSMRHVAALSAVTVGLPVICTLIGATSAALYAAGRFSRKD